MTITFEEGQESPTTAPGLDHAPAPIEVTFELPRSEAFEAPEKSVDHLARLAELAGRLTEATGLQEVATTSAKVLAEVTRARTACRYRGC